MRFCSHTATNSCVHAACLYFFRSGATSARSSINTSSYPIRVFVYLSRGSVGDRFDRVAQGSSMALGSVQPSTGGCGGGCGVEKRGTGDGVLWAIADMRSYALRARAAQRLRGMSMGK